MEKQIYLAGGCFWGLEEYFSFVCGVTQTQVGYANGQTQNPTYEDVCFHNTGHSETVKITYVPDKITLENLLTLFLQAIDPTSYHRQGGDTGSQYRSGIYYTDLADKPIIEDTLQKLSFHYTKPIVVEVLPLQNYYPAEEYHQHYLKKHPEGYCHISPAKMQQAKSFGKNMQYKKASKKELKEKLTDLQYAVTMQNATEKPYENEYYNHFEEGIYVDITTGQPLFLSLDKFDAGCGWPSFAKPISKDVLKEKNDFRFGMSRTEVKSKCSDAHLGHVFPDGPKELGGLRYCINSAALRFIPKKDMASQGYADLLPLFEKS